MKKKVVALCAAMLVCTLVVASLHRSQSNHKGNELLLMNVEALATGESNVPITCVGSGCVICPRYGVKVKYVVEGWSLEDFE